MSALFARSLIGPYRSGVAKAWTAGFGQAFTGFMSFAVYSLAFYAAARFMQNGWIVSCTCACRMQHAACWR